MYEKRIALMQRRRLKPVARVGSPQEHVKPSRLRLKLLHATRRSPMQQITITFRDDDTLPDRLRKMADELSVPVEMLMIRAIEAYLGNEHLTSPPDGFQTKSLVELFQSHGLMKPKT